MSAPHARQNLDFFDILRVSQNATDQEIRQAYLNRAREAHPDRGGSKEDMQVLIDAYNHLKTADVREVYKAGQDDDEPEAEAQKDQAAIDVTATTPHSTMFR